MERLLFRPEEAAQALGIGRSKIFELIAAGQLPSVHIGRSVRVPAQALRTWVDRLAGDTDSQTFDAK